MKMIENGYARCVQDNERGHYTIGKVYKIHNGFIIDDRGDYTNFGNVRRWFKGVIVSE